eukprot:Nk52_evm56s359 gene=Nk52_evmTU56s359
MNQQPIQPQPSGSAGGAGGLSVRRHRVGEGSAAAIYGQRAVQEEEEKMMAGRAAVVGGSLNGQQPGTEGESSRGDHDRGAGSPDLLWWYRPNVIPYNQRFILAFMPCIFYFTFLGNFYTFNVFLIGASLLYVVDSFFGQSKYVLYGLWLWMLCIEVCLVSSSWHLLKSSLMNGFLLSQFALFAFFLGALGSIHSSYLIKTHPRAVILFEQMLFAGFPLNCVVLVSWGSTVVGDHTVAPFVCCIVFTLVYRYFSLPIVSAFRSPSVRRLMGKEHMYILGARERGIHTLGYIFFPMLMYLASNYGFLLDEYQNGTSYFGFLNTTSSILFLVGVPIVCIYLQVEEGSLVWISASQGSYKTLSYWIHIYGVTFYFALMLVLEVKVVFGSFAHLIKIRPPGCYFHVTTGLFVACLIPLLHWVGVLKHVPSHIMTFLFAIPMLLGLLVIGAPVYFAPLPFLGGLFMSNYYSKPSIQMYFGFVAALSILLGWFVKARLYQLDFYFKTFSVGLQGYSVILAVNFSLGLLIPALYYFVQAQGKKGKLYGLLGSVCFIHTFVLAISEAVIFFEHSSMYPWYYIILSSIGGVYTYYSYAQKDVFSRQFSCFLASAYASKPFMILWEKSISSPVDFVIYFGVTNFFMYSVLRLWMFCNPYSSMSKPFGLVHFVRIGAATFASFPFVIEPTLQHVTGKSRYLSISRIGGSLVLVWSILVSPLVRKHFSNTPNLQRITSIMIVCSLTMLVTDSSYSFSKTSLGSLLCVVLLISCLVFRLIDFSSFGAAAVFFSMAVSVALLPVVVSRDAEVAFSYPLSWNIVGIFSVLSKMYCMSFLLCCILMATFAEAPNELTFRNMFVGAAFAGVASMVAEYMCLLRHFEYEYISVSLFCANMREMVCACLFFTAVLGLSERIRYVLVWLSHNPIFGVKDSREFMSFSSMTLIGELCNVSALVSVFFMYFLTFETEQSPLSLVFIAPILLTLNKNFKIFGSSLKHGRIYFICCVFLFCSLYLSCYFKMSNEYYIELYSDAVKKNMHAFHSNFMATKRKFFLLRLLNSFLNPQVPMSLNLTPSDGIAFMQSLLYSRLIMLGMTLGVKIVLVSASKEIHEKLIFIYALICLSLPAVIWPFGLLEIRLIGLCNILLLNLKMRFLYTNRHSLA